MRDYLNIGSTPAEEDCAQVGTADYARNRVWNAHQRMIDRLYTETLERYDSELIAVRRLIEVEREAVRNAIEQRHRFHVRHGIQDFAEAVFSTEAKLALFSEMVWGNSA